MNWKQNDGRTWECEVVDLFDISITLNDGAWDWYIMTKSASAYEEIPFQNGREANVDLAKRAVLTALRDFSLDLVQALGTDG